MALGQEAAILNQLKKGQGETNERLEQIQDLLASILAELQRR